MEPGTSSGEVTAALKERRWVGYLAALVGSLAGGFWLGGWLVTWMITSSPGSIAVLMFGPILLVPLGSALGVLAALAVSRQHSALLTAVLTLPVTIVIWLLLTGLTRLIDVMDFGWLVIVPPLIAPLGARFIVLGRKSRPTAAMTRISPPTWPRRRTAVVAALVGLGVLAILLAVNMADSSDSESTAVLATGPRPCECEQLTTWVEDLSLPGTDGSVRPSRIAELAEGFVIAGGAFGGEDYDPDTLWRSFEEAGLEGVELIDEGDRWSATFFDGPSRADSPWIVDATLIGSYVDFRMRVRVDGGEWGITDDSGFWELYRTDRARADEIREERQARAIEILAPVGDVLRDGGEE
jgi:hypothetical protein